MRLVFAGTPGFAVPVLERLLASGHEVAAVLTRPDRPAGRGRERRTPPVKTVADELGIPVRQPVRLDNAECAVLCGLAPDLMVVVAYGLLVPQAILDVPRLGCINVHASLLPRWRGAAPVQRAIEAGDAVTGITLMRMDRGLDTGDILVQVEEPIRAEDSTDSLARRLSLLGAETLAAMLPAIAAGRVRPRPQDAARACYAARVDKREAHIDWTQPAVVIERRVRAFDPSPVAWTRLGDERIRVWRAALDGPAPVSDTVPGTVIEAGDGIIAVATGDRTLRLTRLQRPGGRPMDSAEFLRGFRLRAGDRLA